MMQTTLATRITLCAALVAAGLGLSACDSDTGEPEELRAAEPPATHYAPAKLSEKATTPAPALAPAELPSPPTAAPAPAPAEWQGWVEAEVARIQGEAPDWYAHVMSVEPQATRAGFLRFVGPELEDPNAAPVLLHRYLEGGDDAEARAAVVAALGRTQGDYAVALADLIATEGDAQVRVGMLASLRRAEGPAVLRAFELAAADVDAEVRVAAAINAGRHKQGADFETPLLVLASDDDARVQAAAARSLGYVKADATSELAGLLDSEHAEVRLAALQAIDRIDPSVAAQLGSLAALTADSDPTVARAAQKIANR